jgi:hypothetical protein
MVCLPMEDRCAGWLGGLLRHSEAVSLPVIFWEDNRCAMAIHFHWA